MICLSIILAFEIGGVWAGVQVVFVFRGWFTATDTFIRRDNSGSWINIKVTEN